MIKIYTDGSCLENPGNGGWAAIINDGGDIKKVSGSEKNTTNNRMELMAPINALKNINSDEEIIVYTDSQYVKLGITEWINSWVKNNWKTSKKEDLIVSRIPKLNTISIYFFRIPLSFSVTKMISESCFKKYLIKCL